MKKHNKSLDMTEFDLIFYIMDGNAHIERGQTAETMSDTIAGYMRDYELQSIEMLYRKSGVSQCIELYYFNPF